MGDVFGLRECQVLFAQVDGIESGHGESFCTAAILESIVGGYIRTLKGGLWIWRWGLIA